MANPQMPWMKNSNDFNFGKRRWHVSAVLMPGRRTYGICREAQIGIEINMMLMLTELYIRKLLNRFHDLFNRDTRDPFKASRPVEVSLPAETALLVDRLEARYNIEVTVPAEPLEFCEKSGPNLTSIEVQPATSEEASWYIPLFEEEFGFYPPLLVENTRITRVVLCGELFRSRQPIPGQDRRDGQSERDGQPFSYVRKPCGGVPYVKDGVLYMSVTWGRDDPDYMRKLAHHEFYHCVQSAQFGGWSDPEWAAFNAPDFEYGPGGEAAKYSPDRTFWITPAVEWGNGFLNHYSMSAPEEDQAEIFAHLVTEPARVEARMQVDEILRGKVERLKATLEQFCYDMDDRFWQRVEESRQPFDF